MLDIVICEDNALYRDYLKKSVNSILKEQNIKGKIRLACESADEIASFLSANEANVFLLDILLKGKDDGFAICETLHDAIEDPYIVFISENTDYVFQSFKVKAYDFLPKPVSKDSLCDVIKNIESDIQKSNSKERISISVKSGSVKYILFLDEILYIEKQGNKISYTTPDQKISCYKTLEVAITELSSHENFIRAHKSFIVNTNYIRHVDIKKLEITMANDEICYLGKKYLKEVQKVVTK